MLKSLWHLLRTEIILRVRNTYDWFYPLSFFLMTLSLFPLVFTLDIAMMQKLIVAYIWIAALFASILSIQHIFSTDLEEAYLEQFFFSEIPLSIIVSIKLLAQWLITQLPLILCVPLLSLFFHLSTFNLFALCLSLLLGTPILTALGAFVMALIMGLRQQGMLLSLLILPLIMPVLIFGVNIIEEWQAGFSIAGPLAFFAALTVLAILLLPIVIAATLKIAWDD